ncbi:DUF488 domain-containing protein [Streptomyces venezuelae]|uniref:DUF488 domain-containing protein n=1 Tax=Streptomyces venezuelae TaxID=54571 RepID=A0A5P2D336_STRVZ|nr:DUF488 family protein [Streptomyces venezuelae]QES48448.1 DUF488 domain-containing protein [Streptomyces venezuelae]
MIRLRRVYEPPDPVADGVRVLVDRLWPRGLAKAEAGVDEWPKVLTPSAELRTWYHSGAGSWEEFRARYEAELAGAGAEAEAALAHLRAMAAAGTVTLLTAVKEPGQSHAAVLAEVLAGPS